MLNELEDSRSAGLPTQPDHTDPTVQHHCCVWPERGPCISGP